MRKGSWDLAKVFAVLCLQAFPARLAGADVQGYSLLKGRFLNQTAPGVVVPDPDFKFSFLASVDLTDYDLLQRAFLDFPDGGSTDLEDYGDSWGLLDIYDTEEDLHSAYGWGQYTVSFAAVDEGGFECPLDFPLTPLPPIPTLVNYDSIDRVDPARPWTLTWEFDTPPETNDFVQVYVSYGHGSVFSTPDIGLPGAMDGTARTVTLPAGTLWYEDSFELNLEITRVVSTNTASYPDAEGVAATFSSTSLIVSTVPPALLRVLPSTNRTEAFVVVTAPPASTVVLQASDALAGWVDLATNAAASGTNAFPISTAEPARRFFRARMP